MTQVAFVDHSYHRKTRATAFLPEILRARGHDVEIFWDEAWNGGEPVAWERVSGHDIVIMFQSHCPTNERTFASRHPNVVFVPMFDQLGLAHDRASKLSKFWMPFQQSKVLSFSTAVHVLATGAGIVSRLTHYYPEIPSTSRHVGNRGLHGFFWLRRELELSWDLVRTLIGSTSFDSFHLHVVGDPGFPAPQLPSREELEEHHITVSGWLEQRRDFDEVVSRANVYFAPRLEEGIGQAFLEAMGRGQCVVGPEQPYDERVHRSRCQRPAVRTSIPGSSRLFGGRPTWRRRSTWDDCRTRAVGRE